MSEVDKFILLTILGVIYAALRMYNCHLKAPPPEPGEESL